MRVLLLQQRKLHPAISRRLARLGAAFVRCTSPCAAVVASHCAAVVASWKVCEGVVSAAGIGDGVFAIKWGPDEFQAFSCAWQCVRGSPDQPAVSSLRCMRCWVPEVPSLRITLGNRCCRIACTLRQPAYGPKPCCQWIGSASIATSSNFQTLLCLCRAGGRAGAGAARGPPGTRELGAAVPAARGARGVLRSVCDRRQRRAQPAAGRRVRRQRRRAKAGARVGLC